MDNITLKELLDHLKDIKMLVNNLSKNNELPNICTENDIFERNSMSSENKIIYLSSSDHNNQEKIMSLSSPEKVNNSEKLPQRHVCVPQKEVITPKEKNITIRPKNIEYVILTKKQQAVK